MQIIHKPIEPSDIAFSDKINSSQKFIDDALEYAHGTHDFYDIVKTVIAGDAQFFYADDKKKISIVVDRQSKVYNFKFKLKDPIKKAS